MQITFVFPCFATKPSGGHKVIYEYANELASKGHDVSCVYLPQNTFYQLHLPNALRIIILDIYIRLYGPRKWFALDKNIKNRVYNNKTIKSDLVLASAIETSQLVKKFPAQSGKQIYLIQDFENWNCSEETVYASYNAGMTNIVVAKWLKEIVDKHSTKPSFLVSNGINTDLFNCKGLERRRHSIVFHYRDADYKGPQYALEVIRKLADKYNDLVADVISIEDKPETLPKCCIYHQKITPKEVAKINNHTEIFMCTSIEEGFGLPGLEAMACGCAVVSSSYKGVLEYAVDGENALLSPIRDVDTMVANIVSLFEDDELRKKIARNGIETGKERSLEKSAKEFEKILMDI